MRILLSEGPWQVVHCDAATPIACRSQSKENQPMALRGKVLSKTAPDPEEPAQELFSQRRKPDIGQFRLQVDRQTKASFTTYEAAEEAGLEIKKGHPVVRVAVYDAVECVNRIIELPDPAASST
jgi:hypothetical protein